MIGSDQLVTEEKLNFRHGSFAVPTANVSFSLARHFGLENEMHIMKYATLLDIASNCVANESTAENPQKTVDNFKSACKAWLTFLGKEIGADNVGAELNTKFEEKTTEFFSQLKSAGFSEATIRDRKSAIKKLRNIYQLQSSILKGKQSSNLGTELRRLLLKADWTSKQLASLSGVPDAFIRRQMNGAKPQKDGLSKIKRLEKVLLKHSVIEKPGHLTELIKFIPKTSTKKLPGTANDVFGLNPDSISEANLCFTSITDKPLTRPSMQQLRTEFPALYKFFDLYRAHKISSGMWTVHSIQKKQSERRNWIFNHNGALSHAPTFDSYLNTLTNYLGYLLDYQKIPKVSVDSIENLIDASLLVSFALFMKSRRNGVLGGNGPRINAFCSEISKEVIRQVNAGLIDKPSNYSKVSELKENIGVVTKKVSVARIRNPWHKLSPFFELDEPAKPLIEISRTLISKAKSPQTFIQDAICLRDAFLLQFLAALPLRERTVMSLTYKDDNTGNFRYSKKEQCWIVDIPANMIKNQIHIRRSLPRSFNALIEAYLGEARPRLLETYDGAKVEWLFPAKNTRRHEPAKEFVDEDGDTYNAIPGQLLVSQRLAKITSEMLGIAIRTHAFRHLMATRFLKLNPGQYQACADLLGDKIETVTAHYAYHDMKWNEQALNESIEKAFK